MFKLMETTDSINLKNIKNNSLQPIKAKKKKKKTFTRKQVAPIEPACIKTGDPNDHVIVSFDELSDEFLILFD